MYLTVDAKYRTGEMADQTRDIARLLEAHEAGDESALERLFPVVYDELRRVARGRRREWRSDFTLNTTALLHEAYLKLAGASRLRAKTRSHFFALASKAMRQILITYARDRNAAKRGGRLERVTYESATSVMRGDTPFGEPEAASLVALDEALTKLQQVDERRGTVVECRFFGGMSFEETAAALGVSARTVKRDWTVAQAWLQRELQRTP